jgi:hypothetical protein
VVHRCRVHTISAAMLAFVSPDAVRAAFRAAVDATGEGLADSERSNRRRELTSRLDEVETAEEQAGRVLEAKGLQFDRRADARPSIVASRNDETDYYDKTITNRLVTKGDNDSFAQMRAASRKQQARDEVRRIEQRVARWKADHAGYLASDEELVALPRAREELELANRELEAANAAAERSVRLANAIRSAIAEWDAAAEAKKPRRENWLKSWLPKPAMEAGRSPYIDSTPERQLREEALLEQSRSLLLKQ